MNDSKQKDFLLGGQAVIEGVMMRSPNYYTVAVRKENGDVVVQRTYRPRITDRNPILGLPVIRGIMTLGQSLSIGIKALNFSADVFTEEEDKKKAAENRGTKTRKSAWSTVLTVAVAITFAFTIIILIPLWLTDLVVSALPGLNNSIYYNLIDGIFRVLFFLAYILLISLIPDILRVFQYHGAEHMSVYAGEEDDEITVENARKHSPYHPRCGTSFLLIVMLVAIVVFSFTPVNEVFWLKILIRTPLIPIIAGLSYEILKLSAKHNKHWLFAAVTAPGLWLQRLTAKRPDDSQLEVAVTALRQVLELEERYAGEPIPAGRETILLTADT